MIADRKSGLLRSMFLCTAVLLTAGGSLAWAQTAAAPEANPAAKAPVAEGKVDPKAKAVLDRYIEVTGGRAAYEKIKSRELKSTIEIVGQGITGVVISKQVSPDKIINSTNLTGLGVIEQGLNGDVAWTRSPMEGLRLLTDKEIEQLRMQATAESSLLDPEKTYTSIQLGGEVVVEGKPATQIELDGTGGKMSQLYDKETGFMVQMTMTLVTPQGEIPMTTSLTDYKDVGGIKVPHLSVGSVGPMQIKTVVTEVKLNPELPAETFAVPEDVKNLKKDKK